MQKSPENKDLAKTSKRKVLNSLGALSFVATSLLATHSAPTQAAPNSPAIMEKANIQPSVEQRTNNFVSRYASQIMGLAHDKHAQIQPSPTNKSIGPANYVADFNIGKKHIVAEIDGLTVNGKNTTADKVSYFGITVFDKSTDQSEYELTMNYEDGGWLITTNIYDKTGTSIISYSEFTTANGSDASSGQLTEEQLSMIINSNETMLSDGFIHIPGTVPIAPTTTNQTVL